MAKDAVIGQGEASLPSPMCNVEWRPNIGIANQRPRQRGWSERRAEPTVGAEPSLWARQLASRIGFHADRRRRPPAWMGPASSPTPRLVGASPHVPTRPVPGAVPGNAWVDYRRTMALFPLLASTPLRRHCHLTATCRDGSRQLSHPYPLAFPTPSRAHPSGTRDGFRKCFGWITLRVPTRYSYIFLRYPFPNNLII